MAKIISIVNQKGGTGKTTNTILLSNYISLRKQDKIIVIDCDIQASSEKLRLEDISSENSNIQYDIITVEPTKLPEQIQLYEEDYDYIFLDLPGNMAQKGVKGCYAMVDIMFIPTRTSKTDIESTYGFIQTLYKDIIPIRENYDATTEIYLFLTIVKRNTRSYKEFISEKNNYNIKVLEADIPDMIKFQDNINTIDIIPESIPFCKEAYEIISK